MEISAYFTERRVGIQESSYEEASQIKRNEVLEACKILKVRPVFLEQMDGNCEITKTRYPEMYNFFKEENPDIVITRWQLMVIVIKGMQSNCQYADAFIKY